MIQSCVPGNERKETDRQTETETEAERERNWEGDRERPLQKPMGKRA